MKGVASAKRSVELLLLLMLTALVFTGAALAQVPVDENGNPIAAIENDQGTLASPGAADGALLSTTELEELVGPVALYPDDLLAIVLPASTYPLEIVQAARFLERLEVDSTLEPDESWDESVVALLNYPEVIRMMDEDIDWTWRLGEAVIAQQSDVIAAVELFRDRAYAAGNLQSDEHQTVTVEEGAIEIEPVDEEIIYVPYYEPEEVVVYQPRRVYYYYPDPYPVYYYPYPAGYRFRSGLFWGVTTAFHIGWSNHYLHVYHPTYWGHPYYGRSYYDYYYYRRPSIAVFNNWYVTNNYYTSNYRYRDGNYWRPRVRAGARPNEPRVRNYYYPPNTTDRTGRGRDNMNFSNRDRLQVSRDGRMNLNLRERQGTPTRTGSRDGMRNGGNNQAVATNRTATRRDGAAGNRASANTRNRDTAAVNRSASRTVNRQSGNRSEIRFRDRGSESPGAGSSRTSRSSTANRDRAQSNTGQRLSAQSTRPSTAATTRRNTTGTTGRRSSTALSPARSPGANASSARRETPTVRRSSPGNRQSAPSSRSTRSPTPTIRQSASSGNRPSRATAPTIRQSAPSGSRASRASAPTSRQSAPSRPSASASRSSNRAGSSSGSRSSNRGSSGGQSRRSGSSRVRNQD